MSDETAPDGVEDDGDLDDLDDEEEDEPEGLRVAVARTLDVDEASLFFDIAPSGAPDLTVFAAHAGRRATAGIFDGESVELDPEVAVQRLADAWAYDEARPVAARTVAAAVGTIEGHPGAPFLDDDAIALAGAGPDVTPPEEVIVDGAPGVRFWNSTSRLSPYRVTFFVVDGSARIRRG